MKLHLLSTLALLALSLTSAAAAGLSRDFSGTLEPNWGSDNQYILRQRDGALEVSVNKTIKWAGFTYTFDAPMDLSAKPVVNLVMRAEPGFLLTLYLRDAAGNINITYPVYTSQEMHTYTFDFTGKTGIDLTKVTGLIFAFNGAALSLTGKAWIDEMHVGDAATNRANFSATPGFSTYRDRSGLAIRINKIQNASAFALGGGTGLIRNVSFDAIAGGVTFLRFDTVPGASGSAKVTLTATGSNGAANSSQDFTITVEDNLPPTIATPPAIVAVAGQPASHRLSGISDGNRTATQPLTFTAVSANPALTGAITVARDGDSPYALLQFTPAATGSTTVDLTVSDNAGGSQSTTISFPVNIYSSLNTAPAVNPVGKQVIVANKGTQTIILTGIGDGDNGSQQVSISAVSENPALIANPVQVDYAGGDTATLTLTPVASATGLVNIIVTLTDNGGAAGNNGNQSSVLTIPVETVQEPLTGYAVSEAAMPFQGNPIEPGTWRIEGQVDGQFKAILPSLVEKDGAPAFKFEMVNKTTWAGVWVNLPDLDLSANPSISYEVLVEVTTQSKIQTHVYFWDDNLAAGANGARNSPGANNARMDIFPGAWRKFAVNYNNVTDGLIDSNGVPINTKRIQRILFNFHPSFGWPFTNETFTVYVRRIRLGDQAEVAGKAPDATVEPVPDQLHAATASPSTRTVTLRNLTNGAGLPASIQVSTTNAAVVQDLAVGPVSVDGTAVLTYKTSAAGSAVINLQATASGSNPAADSFAVQVVAAASPALTLTVNRGQKFQTIRGFGTFEPPASYLDLYARDLGASAMRIGQIGNQAEAFNDNSDPLVLDRGSLDYGVWDFAKLRRFREAGVETFIYTTWGPAGWLKENLSDNYMQASAQTWEGTDNRLDVYYFEEYAENLVAVLRMLKEEAGIDVAAVGPQNEPAFSEPYASAILSPQKFAELIAVIGPRFEAEGLNTLIMMPEQVFSQSFYPMSAYIDAVQAHPVANKYTQVVATHGYAADGVGGGQPNFSAWTTMWNNSQEGAYPKEMWMSETYPENAGFASALNYAMYLYGALKYGNVSLWTSWNIESQLIRLGSPIEQYHAFKNYSKYVRPGARRVAVTEGGSVYATAYEDAEEQTVTLVIVNQGDAPVVAAVAAASGTQLPAAFARHLTQEYRDFENMGAVTGTVLLPARSVTTLVGSTAPAAAPVITSPLAASATESVSFSYTIAADNLPTSYAATGLPAGLTLDTATGAISGSPARGTAGTANVTISATNSAGTDTGTLVLTIAPGVNLPPVASFTATPASGMVPLAVQFNASASSDPDGAIASYAWDFGDQGLGSGVTAAHTYVAAGEYTVKLTVTDTDGATAVKTGTVFVTARPVVTFADAVLSYPAAGSGGLVSYTFTIAPSDAAWTASDDAVWLNLLTTSGTGPGSLSFRVQANTGGPRTARITMWDAVLVIEQAGVSPWAGFPATGGWRDTDIGWLRDDTYPWIYHADHGYCYHVAAGASDYFLYNSLADLGWLYVAPAAYPYMYSYKYAGWVWFLEGATANGVRWFYNASNPAYSGDGWFTVPE